MHRDYILCGMQKRGVCCFYERSVSEVTNACGWRRKDKNDILRDGHRESEAGRGERRISCERKGESRVSLLEEKANN